MISFPLSPRLWSLGHRRLADRVQATTSEDIATKGA